jgi:hypothetical protein
MSDAEDDMHERRRKARDQRPKCLGCDGPRDGDDLMCDDCREEDEEEAVSRAKRARSGRAASSPKEKSARAPSRSAPRTPTPVVATPKKKVTVKVETAGGGGGGGGGAGGGGGSSGGGAGGGTPSRQLWNKSMRGTTRRIFDRDQTLRAYRDEGPLFAEIMAGEEEARHQFQMNEENISASQTAYNAQEREVGNYTEILLAHVQEKKQQMRSTFDDEDRYRLLGILERLVNVINTLTAKQQMDHQGYNNHQLEFHYAIFTVFPAIYCQRRRGGKKADVKYKHFLRKRIEEKSFYAHVLKFLGRWGAQDVSDLDEEDDAPEFKRKRQTPAQQKQEDDDKLKYKIESLTRQGKSTQAIAALDPSRVADLSPDVKQRLMDLHPAADDANHPITGLNPPGSVFGGEEYFERGANMHPHYTEAALRFCLRTMKSHAAPGLSGWTKELMVWFLDAGSSTVKAFVVGFLNQYLNLTLSSRSLTFICNSFLFPLYKVAPDVRPVSIPCFLNKLAWKLAWGRVPDTTDSDSVQLGLGTKGGCQATVFTIQAALYKGMVVVALDAINGFSSIHRDSFLAPFFKDVRYKSLWPLLYLNYKHVTYSVMADGTRVPVTRGGKQGGVEVSHAFGLGLADIMSLVPTEDGVSYCQIVDDIFVIVDPAVFDLQHLQQTVTNMEITLHGKGLDEGLL